MNEYYNFPFLQNILYFKGVIKFNEASCLIWETRLPIF
jgi:hypothetical protein